MNTDKKQAAAEFHQVPEASRCRLELETLPAHTSANKKSRMEQATV